ncbi:MAG: hypothetical protein KC442_17270 [Thermomicrobiales bacterium]|nr:hypothetical protein [Thermomicrobiales bacterium]
MSAEMNRLRIDGYTFWQARGAGSDKAVELTTATGIDLDDGGCRWEVRGPGARTGRTVASTSREVVGYMRSVSEEMRRETRRAATRPPVPKPTTKRRQVPPMAPVPCPACHGGAWFDCDLCDGTGVVTQRQAEAWERDHDG